MPGLARSASEARPELQRAGVYQARHAVREATAGDRVVREPGCSLQRDRACRFLQGETIDTDSMTWLVCAFVPETVRGLVSCRQTPYGGAYFLFFRVVVVVPWTTYSYENQTRVGKFLKRCSDGKKLLRFKFSDYRQTEPTVEVKKQSMGDIIRTNAPNH